jgi:very-short-patch-repair endonuclease
MGGGSDSHGDAWIARLAARQGGAVARRQLIGLGLTARQIDRRAASGHLHLKHRGVYAVGHPKLSPEGRRWAAVLAAGEGAALGYWSNAVHRGLLTGDGPRVEVVVSTPSMLKRPGIAIHRAALAPHEVQEIRGLRCTSVPRMLLELAATKGATVTERAWRQAAYLEILEMDAVAELLQRRRGERGTVLLRSLYDRRAEIIGRLIGDTEDLLLPIIRDSNLVEPISNASIWVGYRHVMVDFYFPSLKLAIEGDSRLAHADPEAEAEDALRDTELKAIGIHVHRVIWDDARWRPNRVLRWFNTLATR